MNGIPGRPAPLRIVNVWAWLASEIVSIRAGAIFADAQAWRISATVSRQIFSASNSTRPASRTV
jgi:hypothetical protein